MDTTSRCPPPSTCSCGASIQKAALPHSTPSALLSSFPVSALPWNCVHTPFKTSTPRHALFCRQAPCEAVPSTQATPGMQSQQTCIRLLSSGHAHSRNPHIRPTVHCYLHCMDEETEAPQFSAFLPKVSKVQAAEPESELGLTRGSPFFSARAVLALDRIPASVQVFWKCLLS